MLRTKDKKFLIKIFNSNKDKLYDLATFHMPKYIFNDPILVSEMTKLTHYNQFNWREIKKEQEIYEKNMGIEKKRQSMDT